MSTVAAVERVPNPHWRRTVIGLSIAIFGGGFGFSFVTPFLAIFFDREFGVHDPGRLAFLVGLALGLSSLATAVASPIWGSLADRFGRKAMVLRATLVAGVVTVLIGLSQNPAQVIAARFLIGLGAGVTTASAGLIASEAPASGVSWGVGVLNSSLALGAALGPPLSGLLALLLPLRWVFLLGGAVMLCSTLPVVFMARETNPPKRGSPPPSLPAALRAAPPGTVRAIFTLIACQLLLQLAYYGSQQLLVVRLVALRPPQLSLTTGLIFGGMGVAAGAAGFNYSRLLRPLGFRRLGGVCGLVIAAGLAGLAVAPSPLLIGVAATIAGLVYGAFYPAINSMVALEAPAESKAGVFGLNGSAFSGGAALGPLLGGFVGPAIGLSPTLLLMAAVAVLPAVGVWRFGREPLTLAPATSPGS